LTAADLLKLWAELADDRREGEQEVRRRITPDAAVDVFVIHSTSAGAPGLVISTATSKPLSFTNLKPCRGIVIRTHASKAGPAHNSSLTIILDDPSLASIFAVLCADLIGAILNHHEAESAYMQGISRLARWLVMFDRLPSDGLSREQRLGLFGEMHMLARLSEIRAPDYAVKAWRGWDAQHQDFRVGGLGLEVKTSSAKLHARIRISNEKQLDERPWDRLVLGFVQVDVNIPNGSTLPEIINGIRDGLKDYPGARQDLNMHLLDYGYTDAQSHLYENETYTIRKVTYFHVHGDFPRLTGDRLPLGVGDINYTIVASDLEAFKIATEQFQELVAGEEG
jgi:hypothetical protein